MAFRCDKCNQVQPKGTKENKVVVEVRKQSYTHYKEDGEIRKVTSGHEIVKEVKCCQHCAIFYDTLYGEYPVVVDK